MTTHKNIEDAIEALERMREDFDDLRGHPTAITDFNTIRSALQNACARDTYKYGFAKCSYGAFTDYSDFEDLRAQDWSTVNTASQGRFFRCKKCNEKAWEGVTEDMGR